MGRSTARNARHMVAEFEVITGLARRASISAMRSMVARLVQLTKSAPAAIFVCVTVRHGGDLGGRQRRNHRRVGAGESVRTRHFEAKRLEKAGLRPCDFVRIWGDHEEATDFHRTQCVHDRGRSGEPRDASRPFDTGAEIVSRISAAEKSAACAGRHDDPHINLGQQLGLRVNALHHLHEGVCTQLRLGARQARKMCGHTGRQVARELHLAGDVPLRDKKAKTCGRVGSVHILRSPFDARPASTAGTGSLATP